MKQKKIHSGTDRLRAEASFSRAEDHGAVPPQMGVSEATFYNWRKKYEGMCVSEVRELRQLREENQKLKQLVADLSLDKHMLQEIIAKKL